MGTTEHTLNDAIANILRETRAAWDADGVVASENTGAFSGNNQRPDILVCEPHTSPVVIETEVLPATTVEVEAKSRLGQTLRSTGRVVLSAIALRLPKSYRMLAGKPLRASIRAETEFELCLFTGESPTDCERWPRDGWLRCSIEDISRYAQSAAVPPKVIEDAAEQLVLGVQQAAALLNELSTDNPKSTEAIASDLRQQDEDQTRRMAATMLANAFVFHETLAGGSGKLGSVLSVDELRANNQFTKSHVLKQWRRILKVNYWPIFDIACRVLTHIPAGRTQPILEIMAETAERLLQNQMMRSHDLTGAIFQKLITDRKFLAAYYTTPAAAALLAGLTLRPKQTPMGSDWSDEDELQKMRVADFACGTGTLLSAAYQRMSQLIEFAGGEAASLHPHMMADVIVGCDVLPAASHLTASMLAGAHPTVKFDQSHILTVPYGLQPDKSVALGSLDLLNPQRTLGVLNITAKAAEGLGEKEKEMWAALPHDAFHLVLMNPPFTRPTGHEGDKVGVPNPMFAAFSSTKEEQRRMGSAMKKLAEGTSYHGNAGEASAFLALADCKLSKDGTLGLVMPMSLLAGDAWEASRKIVREKFGDLIVCTIAGADDDEMSFSADTGMAECLLTARKGKGRKGRALFVVLFERPDFPMLGWSLAEQIANLHDNGAVRKLEDGPLGGTRISFGNDLVGYALDVPINDTGHWNVARIRDLALAQTAHQIAVHGMAWLPGMPSRNAAQSLPMSTVGQIAAIGPYHMDVNASGAGGTVRGPFKVVSASGSPTYPILWAHEADRERTIVFEAEAEGEVKVGKDSDEVDLISRKVTALQATASHAHFNRDWRFNSQSTGMQFSNRKAIGGRAWLSIKVGDEKREKVLALWGNTSVGSLMYWWHANKQQAGRGSIGKNALEDLPVLDLTSLSDKQLDKAAEVFKNFQSKELQPLHEIANDQVRAALDEAFFTEVFGWPAALFVANGPMDLLRQKMGDEPSIHGGR
ncbi:hypothetical protein [Sphingomicrobium sediminis]|uniref:site-specific DNA-methyltransferase (adenine-specific) n=1 Tax=Sphingomicrobium sediminis TaxID=2950949 RepID=A0A9X2ELK7_9SPHN|nr:hypothetical protein [Sphingomicrobium sediminis]MCM8557672.1 hypothetical protein [Sphingomicrobium sediminis]